MRLLASILDTRCSLSKPAGGQVVIGVKGDGTIGGLKTDGYSSGYTYKEKKLKHIRRTLS